MTRYFSLGPVSTARPQHIRITYAQHLFPLRLWSPVLRVSLLFTELLRIHYVSASHVQKHRGVFICFSLFSRRISPLASLVRPSTSRLFRCAVLCERARISFLVILSHIAPLQPHHWRGKIIMQIAEDLLTRSSFYHILFPLL